MMNEMEEEPELTYWKPTPKPLPPPILPPPPVYTPANPSFPLPQRTVMGVTSHFSPPTAVCYPVTDVHMFKQQQSAQVMTDNLIHEEVTRAAKTLFSKRNRTLMHWLNPDISMNQLKTDVNAAWDNLPPTEKVFYVSQVLGKFAPHTTSLMVNPQLDPTMSTAIKMEKGDSSGDAGRSDIPVSMRKKTANTNAKKPKPKKQKSEILSDDTISCDSRLVMDMDKLQPRVKRKYTKRQPKANSIKREESNCSSSNACSLPVDIKDIKVEPGTEATNPEMPRAKRKYVKRKLVRKKYKKREPKNNYNNDTQEEVVTSSVPEPQPSEDMDVWMELDDNTLSREIEDFKLSNEEVDSFWASIDDPSNLFVELEIE